MGNSAVVCGDEDDAHCNVASNRGFWGAAPFVAAGVLGGHVLNAGAVPGAVSLVAGLFVAVAGLRRTKAGLDDETAAEAQEREEALNRQVAEIAAQLRVTEEALAAAQNEINAHQDALAAAQSREGDVTRTDSVTKLPNHRAFHERLRSEMARAARVGAQVSLLLIDVDHFQKYNDYYGHLAGDDALRLAADALLSNVREGDFVARYGGEEFAVILPDTGAEGAIETAERLRLAVSRVEFPHRTVTVSVGAASAGLDAPRDLIARVHAALYQAKHRGRNCVSLDGPMAGRA